MQRIGFKCSEYERRHIGKIFRQIGLAKTEFEILDPQYHCEQAKAENAILFVLKGAGLPTDMRWNWTRKFVIDSCILGDVVAEEWAVLVYMPMLANLQAPQLFQVSKRVIGDAMADYGLAP